MGNDNTTSQIWGKKIKWVKKIVKLIKSGIKLENTEGQVFFFLGFCENLQEK